MLEGPEAYGIFASALINRTSCAGGRPPPVAGLGAERRRFVLTSSVLELEYVPGFFFPFSSRYDTISITDTHGLRCDVCRAPAWASFSCACVAVVVSRHE